MLTHGKSADPGFLLFPGHPGFLRDSSLMLFRDDAEAFAQGEQKYS
jgi:hypothetical protein